MARHILLIAALAGAMTLTATAPLVAADPAPRARDRSEFRERLRDRRADGGRPAAERVTPTATLTYGDAEKQRVDLFAPANGGKGQPIILYVHGGGWAMGSHKAVAAKPGWASGNGLWFGSIGYRYLPEAPVEDQAADVGAAIRKVRADAARHGYDPDRIILMGHSAGAHLAALVATDPAYAGDAFGAIKAVIPIDGAGYDVAAQMGSARGPLGSLYDDAFGSNPARHKALSPLFQVGGRDARRWVIIHVASRADSRAQSEKLARALSAAGASVAVVPVAGTHMTANRDFGTAAYPADATAAVTALIVQVQRGK